MKYIDVSTWKRAMHCEVFRNRVQPQYCVTFDVDITNFLLGVKKRESPSFLKQSIRHLHILMKPQNFLRWLMSLCRK